MFCNVAGCEMEPKHTPGPWALDFGKDGAVISRLDDGPVAKIYPAMEGWEYTAHLFFAAPELLEVLKALAEEAHLNMTGGAGHLIADAWRAIAKAEGRE